VDDRIKDGTPKGVDYSDLSSIDDERSPKNRPGKAEGGEGLSEVGEESAFEDDSEYENPKPLAKQAEPTQANEKKKRPTNIFFASMPKNVEEQEEAFF